MIMTDDCCCWWMWMECSLCCGSVTDEWWVIGLWRLVNTHSSLMSFISFFSRSYSNHILSHSAFSCHSIPSTLILIPFISISLLFYTIVHSIHTLFIIELVMIVVWTIPYSLIHYSSSSITLTSFILSATIWPHSLPIHSISSQSYSCHITSFFFFTSLSLPLSLYYLSLISLAILVQSLFHSIIRSHSILSHTHLTIHHSTLPLLNTLYSIHLLSSPYTLYYHLISFMYYSIHSTTLYSSNTSSLKTHSHYPSITLIYYSYSISFSILFYLPLSLHLFILFIQSYHHEHSAISHTLYSSLYQSFYFDISLSLFYLSILISYCSFINTFYYSFHTHSIIHSFILFISFITLKQLSHSISLSSF